MLLHDSGQVMAGCATVHADKDTPQGFGSAITYARRYGIATLLGIAVATIMSLSKILERSLYPYAILLQTVPVVAVAPVFL